MFPVVTCKTLPFILDPGQFGCHSVCLGCWSIAMVGCSAYFVVYNKDEDTGKNIGEHAERSIIGDHLLKKSKGKGHSQQTGKKMTEGYKFHVSWQQTKPRNGITSSSARCAALLVLWVHWKMNICWMWP